MLFGGLFGVEVGWDSAEEIGGDFSDYVVLALSGTTTSASTLKRKSNLEHLISNTNGRGDLCVVVEAEYFGQVVKRHLISHELLVRSEVALGWDEVLSTLDELVVRLEHLGIVEIFQDDHNAHSVIGIRDTTTIVSFGDHIPESVIWDDLEVVQEHHELSLGDGQVGVTELIRNIPSKWTEFSSLENQGVEEAKSPHKSFESSGFLAALELLFVDGEVGAEDVVFETFWWLNDSLHTVLQNGYRELVTWHRC